MIRTLGTYAVSAFGADCTPRGKAGELLRAILGMGGADGCVHQLRLSLALWPDAEGPSARRNFDTTLYRLRRTLTVEGAVAMNDGCVFLEPSVCHVDANAFDGAARSSVSENDAGLGAFALEHYSGDFLPSFDEAPVEARREFLRTRFLRLTREVAQSREAKHDFGGALRLYERGLDADSSCEPLREGARRCIAALGSALKCARCHGALAVRDGRGMAHGRPSPLPG